MQNYNKSGINAAENQKKSTFMITAPTTKAERDFYSLHAAELSSFATGLVVVQCAWAACDWYAIYKLAQGVEVTSLRSLVIIFATIVLAALHRVLNVSTTLSFTKLIGGDTDKKHFLLPVVIGFSMLAYSIVGANQLAQKYTYKAKDARIDEAKYATMDSVALAIYGIEADRIAEKFDAIGEKTAYRKNRELSGLKNKTIISDADERWTASTIRSKKHEANAAALDVNVRKVKELSVAATLLRKERNRISDERMEALGKANVLANKEADKETQGDSAAINFSWVASFLFSFLFYFFAYKKAFIKHFSGIRKEIEFSAIQEHGGLFALTFGVLSDIFTRKYAQFLSFVHRKGVHNTASIDGFDTRFEITQNVLSNNEPLSFYSKTPKTANLGNNNKPVVFTAKADKTSDNAVITDVITPVIVKKMQGERFKELRQFVATRVSQIARIGKDRNAETIKLCLQQYVSELGTIQVNPDYENELQFVIQKAEAGIRAIDALKPKQDD